MGPKQKLKLYSMLASPGERVDAAASKFYRTLNRRQRDHPVFLRRTLDYSESFQQRRKPQVWWSSADDLPSIQRLGLPRQHLCKLLRVRVPSVDLNLRKTSRPEQLYAQAEVWRGDEVVDKSLWVKLKIDEDSCSMYLSGMHASMAQREKGSSKSQSKTLPTSLKIHKTDFFRSDPCPGYKLRLYISPTKSKPTTNRSDADVYVATAPLTTSHGRRQRGGALGGLKARVKLQQPQQHSQQQQQLQKRQQQKSLQPHKFVGRSMSTLPLKKMQDGRQVGMIRMEIDWKVRQIKDDEEKQASQQPKRQEVSTSDVSLAFLKPRHGGSDGEDDEEVTLTQRGGLVCPWCKLRCSSWAGLVCHLECTHIYSTYRIRLDPSRPHVEVKEKGRFSKALSRLCKMEAKARRRRAREEQEGEDYGGDAPPAPPRWDERCLVGDEERSNHAWRFIKVQGTRYSRADHFLAQLLLKKPYIDISRGLPHPTPRSGLQRPAAKRSKKRRKRVSSSEDSSSSGSDSDSDESDSESSDSKDVARRRKKRRRKQAKSTGKNSSSSNVKRRKRASLLTKHEFYHSGTMARMQPHEFAWDSDDNCYDSWMLEQADRMVDDFDDVTYSEKQFIKMWNAYVCNFKIPYDGIFPAKCRHFASLHGSTLVEQRLRSAFLLHLMSMWEWRLVDVDCIVDCMRICDEAAEDMDAVPLSLAVLLEDEESELVQELLDEENQGETNGCATGTDTAAMSTAMTVASPARNHVNGVLRGESDSPAPTTEVSQTNGAVKVGGELCQVAIKTAKKVKKPPKGTPTKRTSSRVRKKR